MHTLTGGSNHGKWGSLYTLYIHLHLEGEHSSFFSRLTGAAGLCVERYKLADPDTLELHSVTQVGDDKQSCVQVVPAGCCIVSASAVMANGLLALGVGP